jgi:hypothetical protein
LIFTVAEQAKQETDKEHAENRLHSIISQKTEFFMMATVRNSTPTQLYCLLMVAHTMVEISTILPTTGGKTYVEDIHHTVCYWLHSLCR